MGSSMGGIISFQAALLHPDVFGAAACLSPVFWFKDEGEQDYFDLLAHAGKAPVRVYLDSGTAGRNQDGAADTRRMGKLLLEAGWKEGGDLMRYEATGAEHNERAWRARLDKPLVFLFGR
jgi:predicted alpha/beta superfamily hydrolase